MTAHIRSISRDENDLGRLREEWRLLAKEWVAAQDVAERWEEQRKVALDEMTLALIKEGMPATRAEKEARVSEQFKDILRKFHDAKRKAKDLYIDQKNAEMAYWARNGAEATERAERRMSRG